MSESCDNRDWCLNVEIAKFDLNYQTLQIKVI